MSDIAERGAAAPTARDRSRPVRDIVVMRRGGALFKRRAGG